jgi:5'-nucleotidase
VKRASPLLVAAALGAALLDTHALQAQPAAPAVVTILHFNDVYEIEPVEGGKAGGLARVATLLARLKRTSAPVIATLGGDYLSPSAIGTARVDGQPLAGRQMVDVLDSVGLQWATFGNHEFDLSEDAFHARLAQGRFRLVSSNVTDATGKPFENTVVSAIVPVSVRGRTIRVGLIGLTLDSTKKAWVRYGAPVESARSAVAALQGRVDAIVALTHLALAADADLVAAVPEIDVVLGGHEHENWMIQRGPRFTPIIKADANVRSVAIVRLEFGRRGARPSVSARLERIDARLVPDARVAAVVKRWTDAGFNAFRAQGFNPEQVVTTSNEALDGRESTVRDHPGKLTDLILAAMQRETKAEIAVLNGGSIRIDDVVPPGPIREYDIIRMLPFGGKVLKAGIDGSLLVTILDAGLLNQGTGGYLQVAGITRSGGAWLVLGQPIDPRRRYSVALPEFLLTGGEARLGFLQRTNPEVHDVEEFRDIRLTLRDELRLKGS